MKEKEEKERKKGSIKNKQTKDVKLPRGTEKDLEGGGVVKARIKTGEERKIDLGVEPSVTEI